MIVDDDPVVHRVYGETLGAEGFRIEHAADPDQMIDQLTASRVDVLLLDEKLDGSSCWDLLDPIRILYPALPVILLFDRLPSTPERVQAGRLGIVEVLAKRAHTNRLLSAVRKGVAYGRDHGGAAACPPPIVGQSESMRRVRSQISRIAPTSSRVLIHGESGTGKELVARWIHHLSPRSVQPFVALNCSAFPTELFEAELFGH
ncbi:MAG: sigma-54-dependent transcriptional regulator, partial [Rhodothermales bacterium]